MDTSKEDKKRGVAAEHSPKKKKRTKNEESDTDCDTEHNTGRQLELGDYHYDSEVYIPVNHVPNVFSGLFDVFGSYGSDNFRNASCNLRNTATSQLTFKWPLQACTVPGSAWC
jgi:hypothetical protein